MKKNVIENIVPVVISLKHILEKAHSPVLKDLMVYLRELMKDYKTEVKGKVPQRAVDLLLALKNFHLD